jgi:hypothetical protein
MTQGIVQQKLIGWGKLAKADRLHISLKTLNKFGKGALVGELHKAGFVVHTHIFNTEEERKNFADSMNWGVDQCTFDNMELLNTRGIL